MKGTYLLSRCLQGVRMSSRAELCSVPLAPNPCSEIPPGFARPSTVKPPLHLVALVGDCALSRHAV
jgi:hypothetical protein